MIFDLCVIAFRNTRACDNCAIYQLNRFKKKKKILVILHDEQSFSVEKIDRVTSPYRMRSLTVCETNNLLRKKSDDKHETKIHFLTFPLSESLINQTNFSWTKKSQTLEKQSKNKIFVHSSLPTFIFDFLSSFPPNILHAIPYYQQHP